MNPEHRVSRVATAITAGLIGMLMLAPGSAAAGLVEMDGGAPEMGSGVVRTTGPDDTEPATMEPETTEPETTEPETTEPETTDPVDTTPGDEADDEAPGDVNVAVAVVSALAFAALVSLAAWWMLRRNDEDDPRRPPPPTLDEPPPGQDLF